MLTATWAFSIRATLPLDRRRVSDLAQRTESLVVSRPRRAMMSSGTEENRGYG